MKRVYGLTVEQVIEHLGRVGVGSERSIASSFGVHHLTIRRKLEGAQYRGAVIVDDHDADGHRLPKPDWRYTLSEEAQ